MDENNLIERLTQCMKEELEPSRHSAFVRARRERQKHLIQDVTALDDIIPNLGSQNSVRVITRVATWSVFCGQIPDF
ncbi:unnamed protein product [Didymodactylos carnosus]|uniref:Uncharacterized protein n=1 Tax=Didymodactylos carnosus TaxID=1234261 RepID=A0A8S2YFQ3_9BILA|nr:unnamed protein product [Didymodactylos carnosus]